MDAQPVQHVVHGVVHLHRHVHHQAQPAQGGTASWTFRLPRNRDHACAGWIAPIALTVSTPSADAEDPPTVTARHTLPVEVAVKHQRDTEC